MNVAFSILAAAVVTSSVGQSPAAQRKPNVVVVLADDMGWSDLGCYGGEIPTPHIDALAAKGLRFRAFYNNAVCGPSRASLLTGLYAQQVGHGGKNWNDATNFKTCATIGELLRRAGYRTLMVGKWQERLLPARLGFDRFFGPACQGKISYFHEVALNPFYLDETRWKVPANFSLTDALTDHALKFVADAAAERRPFFLYLAHLAPHWPLHAREADIAPHRERYRKGWDRIRSERFDRQRALGAISNDWNLSPRPADVPEWRDDELRDWHAERMAVYAAQVASVDRSVGRLVEALKNAGQFDDTLILILSDNGAALDGEVLPSAAGFGFGARSPADDWRIDGVKIRPGSGPKTMPGPHDTFAGYGPAWANVSNTPFRDAKGAAYEGGIRTPLVAHWPSGIRRPGRWVDEFGHVMDVLPTCLELAGAEYPKTLADRQLTPLEGKSLSPCFRGEARVDGDLCWNAPRGRAIRSGKWSLVNSAVDTWELYDLEKDGPQARNLAAIHPKLAADLAAKHQDWISRCAAK